MAMNSVTVEDWMCSRRERTVDGVSVQIDLFGDDANFSELR